MDFTLSNARRFYSSMANPLAVKGLMLHQYILGKECDYNFQAELQNLPKNT